jgi:hypothetical protein
MMTENEMVLYRRMIASCIVVRHESLNKRVRGYDKGSGLRVTVETVP